jgi:nucleotide-binding universal stress UspA family protein
LLRSIVVALDLTPDGDRALPIAQALAETSDLPVELLTVSSPRMSEAEDVHELRRRLTAHGWPPDSFTIAHDNDVARAIVAHVGDREPALLVMASSAKPSITARFLGSVTEEVLSRVDQPVLLVGPRVPPDRDVSRPTLVAFIDRGDLAEATVPAMVSWARTFGSSNPLLADVTGSSGEPGTVEESPVDRYISLLGAEGVSASKVDVRSTDIDAQLDQLAGHVTAPIFVATSVRWTDPSTPGRSLTQRLVHQSVHPVLVVPARHAPWRRGQDLPETSPDLPLGVIEELSASACWEQLAAASVGRLAVCMSGMPRIFPINFVVDGESIVFRTAEGTKLAALRNPSVAFEIDDYDADSGIASSVIIEGRAEEIAEVSGSDTLGLPLFPWHVSPKGHFVRITPDNVSGRRFRAVYAD